MIFLSAGRDTRTRASRARGSESEITSVRVVIAIVIGALGCKGKATEREPPVPAPHPPSAATLVDASDPAVTAIEGACVGKWRLELDKLGEGTCKANKLELGATFYVVRDPENSKAYVARHDQPYQNLEVQTKADSADACDIVITDALTRGGFTFEKTYELAVKDGKATASGAFGESDKGQKPCTRAFSLAVTKEQITAADLETNEARAQADFEELWTTTIAVYCKLPAQQLPLPRRARVQLSVDRLGRLEKLVIDGVNQGKLEAVCSIPAVELAAAPPSIRNKTGKPHTYELDTELHESVLPPRR